MIPYKMQVASKGIKRKSYLQEEPKLAELALLC